MLVAAVNPFLAENGAAVQHVIVGDVPVYRFGCPYPVGIVGEIIGFRPIHIVSVKSSSLRPFQNKVSDLYRVSYLVIFYFRPVIFRQQVAPVAVTVRIVYLIEAVCGQRPRSIGINALFCDVPRGVIVIFERGAALTAGLYLRIVLPDQLSEGVVHVAADERSVQPDVGDVPVVVVGVGIIRNPAFSAVFLHSGNAARCIAGGCLHIRVTMLKSNFLPASELPSNRLAPVRSTRPNLSQCSFDSYAIPSYRNPVFTQKPLFQVPISIFLLLSIILAKQP